MLFRSFRAGPIPSVARIVRVAATADPGDASRLFPDNAPVPAPPADGGEPGSGPGAFSGRVRG
jgi:hypothetical protein